MPICPRLMELLQEAFDAAQVGQEQVVPLSRAGNVRRRVERAIRLSGVKPWANLWQTLRSSCEKQWASEQLPQAWVSRWIGHSLTVSGKHYLSGDAPDEAFDRVTQAKAAHARRTAPAHQ